MVARKKNKYDMRREDEEGFMAPEVYFAVAISSDKDPHDIVERVTEKWRKKSGRVMAVKELTVHR